MKVLPQPVPPHMYNPRTVDDDDDDDEDDDDAKGCWTVEVLVVEPNHD